MLAKGQEALLFELPGYYAGKVSKVALKDMSANYVVLFFYPKDNTPGCIQEASAFSLLNKHFAKYKVNIIGISKDPIETHKKFVNNYGLNICLVSDEDLVVCKHFGVWQNKKVFNHESFAIVRSTFIIDIKANKIVNSWKVNKVAGHAQEVLNWIKENISEIN
ncbi:MAG: peroxiredoxin [Pseudomonadota bacterium]